MAVLDFLKQDRVDDREKEKKQDEENLKKHVALETEEIKESKEVDENKEDISANAILLDQLKESEKRTDMLERSLIESKQANTPSKTERFKEFRSKVHTSLATTGLGSKEKIAHDMRTMSSMPNSDRTPLINKHGIEKMMLSNDALEYTIGKHKELAAEKPIMYRKASPISNKGNTLHPSIMRVI